MTFIKNNIALIILLLLLISFTTINILINNYNNYKLKKQNLKLDNTIQLNNNKQIIKDTIITTIKPHPVDYLFLEN
jgi:hypothetical protein